MSEANNVYQLHKTGALVNYLHNACLSPGLHFLILWSPCQNISLSTNHVVLRIIFLHLAMFLSCIFYFIFGPGIKQQERDAVAGCATVCVHYDYAYCTVW
jgi:hypothetical protein